MTSPPPTAAAAATLPTAPRLAALVLAAFLGTFLAARIVVLLIMSRRAPDLYLHVGGTHVHHLNYGIFLLTGVGGYLLFARPAGGRLRAAAVAYGVGMGLTFDEFGMWVHLGGSYWQRASYDAVVVIAAALALVALVPWLGRLRVRHLWVAVGLGVGAVLFGALLRESLRYAEDVAGPKVRRLELLGPQ